MSGDPAGWSNASAGVMVSGVVPSAPRVPTSVTVKCSGFGPFAAIVIGSGGLMQSVPSGTQILVEPAVEATAVVSVNPSCHGSVKPSTTPVNLIPATGLTVFGSALPPWSLTVCFSLPPAELVDGVPSSGVIVALGVYLPAVAYVCVPVTVKTDGPPGGPGRH